MGSLITFLRAALIVAASCSTLTCSGSGGDDDSDSDGIDADDSADDDGLPSGPGDDDAVSCTPTTCAEQGAACGEMSDGCGQTLDCGTCAAPLTCGGEGVSNQCAQAHAWTMASSPASSYDIQALWGARPDEVWAVAGGGTLLGGAGQLHGFNGAEWELWYTMATPAFLDIHGVNDGADVFFVGRDGQFYWLTPSEILLIESGGSANHAVWASAPDAVWVGSENLTYPLRFWNGQEFLTTDARYDSPNQDQVTAIWGTAADQVWAADDTGILFFDGNGWTQQYTSDLVVAIGITAIHGSGPDDVWAVGPRRALHFDGTSWTAFAAAENQALYDVWAAGSDDVWMVGDGGRILHGGTAGLEPVISPTTESLYAVWGTGPGDIWAGGVGGTLIHYGPVDMLPEDPGPAEDCNPQGFGCTETPCCAPFRCVRLTGDLLVCE